MEITYFVDLIKNLPYKNQSFEVKFKNWKGTNFENLETNIFNNADAITLNRFDLFNSNHNVEEFIIKTLMWGYPTKGRGNNIDNLLKEDNFKKLKTLLIEIKDKDISLEKIINEFNEISGIGISTITKFLYFSNVYVEGCKSLILDKKLIDIFKNNRFSEFNKLKHIERENALKNYIEYLKNMHEVSNILNVESDKLEMFLFMFGNNLSELKGEEYYGDIDDI